MPMDVMDKLHIEHAEPYQLEQYGASRGVCRNRVSLNERRWNGLDAGQVHEATELGRGPLESDDRRIGQS